MVDWGSNLPPGASSDPNAPFNQKDHSHEHQWEPSDPDTPIIEDGAAIFYEECVYAEGRWGEGWQCEETRRYRFGYDTLVSPKGTEHEIPEITEWNDTEVPEKHLDKVQVIEERFAEFGPGDKVSFDVDPDPDNGVVTIGYCGWELNYAP
jgi:hypothetical protein